jgi:hypothetical protein
MFSSGTIFPFFFFFFLSPISLFYVWLLRKLVLEHDKFRFFLNNASNYDLCFLLSFFSGTEESIVVEIWVLLKFIFFLLK